MLCSSLQPFDMKRNPTFQSLQKVRMNRIKTKLAYFKNIFCVIHALPKSGLKWYMSYDHWSEFSNISICIYLFIGSKLICLLQKFPVKLTSIILVLHPWAVLLPKVLYYLSLGKLLHLQAHWLGEDTAGEGMGCFLALLQSFFLISGLLSD